MEVVSPIRELYASRFAERKAELDTIQKRIRLVAHLRLGLFALTLILGFAVFSPPRLPARWLLVPVGLFLALVVIRELLRVELQLALITFSKILSSLEKS